MILFETVIILAWPAVRAKFFCELLSLEDGTDKFSRNVGKVTSTTRCIIAPQKWRQFSSLMKLRPEMSMFCVKQTEGFEPKANG